MRTTTGPTFNVLPKIVGVTNWPSTAVVNQNANAVKLARVIVSNELAAAKKTMAVAANGPTYGMKLNRAAITPQRTGVGIPTNHITIVTATPNPMLMHVICARYRPTLCWMSPIFFKTSPRESAFGRTPSVRFNKSSPVDNMKNVSTAIAATKASI